MKFEWVIGLYADTESLSTYEIKDIINAAFSESGFEAKLVELSLFLF